MEVSELVATIVANPDRLYVRVYIDFTDPRTPVEVVLLETWLKGCSSGDVPVLVDFSTTRVLGADPYLARGIWSEPNFTKRQLYPRLSAHSLWLVPDQIVTVARLPEGVEVVAPPVGHLVAQHLMDIRACCQLGRQTRGRLLGIVNEYNKKRSVLDLLS